MNQDEVLVTGATGFIGRRLVQALLERGHAVRACSRRPPGATGLQPHAKLTIRQADALRRQELPALLAQIKVAFYLIHSMEGGLGQERDFMERDRQAASAFGQEAAAAGVERIIYLSGLQPHESVSKHLQSRQEVEQLLAQAGVPVTTLRAGFIIGPQSAGFQMLQGVLGQLQVLMVNPDMRHRTQPAYVDDVIQALALCLERPEATRGRTFELGSDVVSYLDMIQEFARHKGRSLRLLEVPWVPRALASMYIAAVSHLPYALIAALFEGLRTDLLVEDESLYRLLPELPRTPMREGMRRAFAELA